MPNGRNRMHGGLSPAALRGNKNTRKHGRYTGKQLPDAEKSWHCCGWLKSLQARQIAVPSDIEDFRSGSSRVRYGL